MRGNVVLDGEKPVLGAIPPPVGRHQQLL